MCVWKLFETQLLPRPIFVVRFGPKTLFSCRNFLGGCQIEFNWDFKMSYRPSVLEFLTISNLRWRKDVKVPCQFRIGNQRKQWLSFCDKLIFQQIWILKFEFWSLFCFDLSSFNWFFLDFSGSKLVFTPWILLGQLPMTNNGCVIKG